MFVNTIIRTPPKKKKLKKLKLVRKQPLARSETNFVTKFKHESHLVWGVYYMSMSNDLPPAHSFLGAAL